MTGTPLVRTELTPDELQDFETALSEYQRSPEEFEVFAQEIRTLTPAPISGTVTVRHRKSGTKCIYETGSGAACWITNFSLDLGANVF